MSQAARWLKRHSQQTYLVLLALLFVSAYLYRPSWAQTPSPAPPQPVAPTAPPAPASPDAGQMKSASIAGGEAAHAPFKYFGFLSDPHFTGSERVLLFVSLAVAV